MMRPGFRTAGAEVSDIEVDGKYAGTLTLAYRDGDRLVGAVQLDPAGVPDREKKAVSDWADEYVHSLAEALRVSECEVLVTYGPFDHIVTAYEQADAADEIDAFDIQNGRGRGRDKRRGKDRGDRHAAPGRAGKGGEAKARSRLLRLELVIVGERGNRIEYHIYDGDKTWLAEAFLTIEGPDVHGEVNWMRDPDDEELAAAADLIVSDFDEREIDSFYIEMKYDGEVVETFALTHKDLLAEDGERKEAFGEDGEPYTVVLVRDDADTLTYDIYDQIQGGLPAGRATVDISGRRMTGMVEFHKPVGSEKREQMATAVLRELDKEKDYDSVNLTMMHRNNRIEDIYFENEEVH